MHAPVEVARDARRNIVAMVRRRLLPACRRFWEFW